MDFSKFCDRLWAEIISIITDKSAKYWKQPSPSCQTLVMLMITFNLSSTNIQCKNGICTNYFLSYNWIRDGECRRHRDNW